MSLQALRKVAERLGIRKQPAPAFCIYRAFGTQMDNASGAFDVNIDDGFDFLSEEYAALFKGSGATAFQHPIWLDHLYNKLAPSAGAKPLVVVARRSNAGALVMVLPLLRLRRGPVQSVEFADLRVSDYLAPVCTAKAFSDLLRDQDACLKIRRLIKPFDLLRLPKLPDGMIPIENLLALSRPKTTDMNAYAARLFAPFEQWRVRAIDQSYQKELAKKSRQLNKKGALSFSCCDDSASIRVAMGVMKQLRGPRFQAQGDGDLLQRPEYFDFYSDVAIAGLGSLVRLYVAKMNEQVIAVVLGLCHRGSFLIVMSAFDIAGYKKQSIGALTFEQVAKDCIERGEGLLDFTIGDEPYKLLFGAEPSPMWSVTQAGSARGSVALFALKRAPWIKAVAKRLTGLQVLPGGASTDRR